MRLTSKEQRAITTSFQNVLADVAFELYLFGSRADDNKKGGDIDLLVVVPPPLKELTIERKNKIRLKIFESLPEQKIDITVATAGEIESDPFLKSIMPKALSLVA